MATKTPTDWIKAAQEELKQLRSFGTFVNIKRSELPEGVQTIPSRFVLRLKDQV